MFTDTFIYNQNIKTRFAVTLFTNIATAALSFFTGIVIAAGLDPAGYGNYSFLLGSFTSITALLDMGTSSAFYTFVSQKRRSSKFYLYYFLWITIQFAVVLSLISVIFPDVLLRKIWLGHTRRLIILGFIASFMMNKVWQAVTQTGESIRATVIVKLYNIIITGLYLFIVSVMFFLHRLNIYNLFITISLNYFLLSFVLAGILRNRLITEEETDLKSMIHEFKVFCAPLIVYGIVGFGYLFADIWLLQKFSGAVHQGFYSVGMRFSSIFLIFGISMINVFWKEIAEANKRGDRDSLYRFYTKASRLLCFTSATAACFFIPFSRDILVSLLGQKYEPGWPCLAIMLLYPIPESLLRITGPYFFATEQTRFYSKIGSVIMLIGIIASYLILASKNALIPGMELGSRGLALKTVIFQIIRVNVPIYFMCKKAQWKFNFLYQFEIIAFLLIASFAIRNSVGWIFHALNFSLHPLVLMGSCMPVYILAAGFIIYLFPGLVGLERKQIMEPVRQFFNRFKETKKGV